MADPNNPPAASAEVVQAPVAPVVAPVAPAAPVVAPAPPSAEIPQGVFDRIDRLTRDKKTAEERALALEAEVARMRQAPPSGAAPAVPAAPAPVGLGAEEIERRAQQIASQRAFTDKCNGIHTSGAAAHPDFAAKMQQLGSLGVFSPDLINAASDIGDPHEILYELANDLTLATQISGLGPTAMTLRLVDINAKRKTRAAQGVSQAPAPTGAVVGGAAAPAVSAVPASEDKSEDWFAKREAQLRARR